MRASRAAAIGAGIGWLAAAGLIAVVVRLGVPTPAELLADVAERPATWIAANVVLIVLAPVLLIARPALLADVERESAAALVVNALVAVGAGALAASGIVHGVFGAHLAARFEPEVVDAELVRLGELTHALGDTWWFVGVAALIGATTVVVASGHTHGGVLRWCGAASVMANLLQFGWFVDEWFGVFAGPGTVLQAAWLIGVGISGRRSDLRR